MEHELTLQPRLRKIASLVPDGARLVDVGTDHGFVPVSLLLHGRIQTAIASDIGAAPLEHARRIAAQYGVDEHIQFRLCDGLQGIACEEADTIVIAGMGGDNIASILSAASWTREGALLLLQPMSKAEMLRGYLPDHGYRILTEQLVEDKGILYPILTVRGGIMPSADEVQRRGGFSLPSDPLRSRYLDEQIRRLRRAATGLAKAKDSAEAQRRETLLSLAEKLEEQKKECIHADST